MLVEMRMYWNQMPILWLIVHLML